ncbi:MAG: nucleotide pyrophosphohydrolase [Hyphomonadaceae bacterium]|nr:nucleotide pyrophosphohydrolase [Hyphomonadaceae bacterium]
MTETSSTIQSWAEPIFGPVADLSDLVDRAALELTELKQALADGETAEARVEAADVVILLHRVAALLGTDLAAEVDAKMAINRARKWVPDGKGAGRHVP